jgi:DNA-binding SARP family transcriptional activator
VQVRVLGPVVVVRDDVSVDIDVPMQRALLAALALHGWAAVTTSQLIDALWGDDPPASAAKTLQGYVSALRKSFGAETITSVPGGYQLGPGVDQVDAIELDALVAAAQRDLEHGNPQTARRSFTAAGALWRGHPLDDVAPGPARDGEVARLDELRLLAVEGLMEAELQLGHHRDVVPELERLVAEHPYRELLWQSLMLALYRSRRAADALVACRQLRTTLVEDLGIEPSAATQALELRILNSDPELEPAAPSPTNLTTPIDSFVDRVEEQRTIVNLVDEHRLVTVLGLGGAGKSRLANEVGRALIGVFPGGVWWVDLAAAQETTSVVKYVASAMRLSTSPGADLETVLLARLRRAAAVLVLDNCEHLRPAVAEFVEWVTSNDPSVRVIATSRVALDVPGEHRVVVEPLATKAAAGHPISDAGRLFLERASARTEMEAADLDDIEAVTDLVAGLPLGIELAAAQCALKTPAEIATTLHDRSALLGLSGSGRDDPRHASLGRVLDTSIDLLEPGMTESLARLAVFPGDFDLAAVSPVTSLAAPDAERLVSWLLDASLLADVSPDARQRRFRVLWPVREYLSGRLAGPDRDVAGAAHAEHYRGFVGRFLDAADTPDEQGWFAQFLDEEHNVRTALSWFEQNAPDGALTFGPALGMAWMNAGDQVEGRDIVRRLLDASSDAPSSLVAWTECESQWLAFLSGEVEAALTDGQDAIARFEQLGDARGLSRALRSQAHALHLGGVEEATTTPIYQRSIDVAEAADLPYSAAISEVRFAHSLATNDALTVVDVEAMLAHAASVLRRHDDHSDLAHAAVIRAMIAWGRTDTGAALSAGEESLRLSRLSGNTVWEQIARVLLGVASHDDRDEQFSRRRLREGLHLAVDTANAFQAGVALQAVGATAAEREPEAAASATGAGRTFAPLYPLFARRYGELLEPARDALGDRFDELVAEGAQLSVEAASALADEIL